MEPDEWLDIGVRILRTWSSQDIREETLVEWYRYVADLTAAEVNKALTMLALEGREFAPHGGIIRKKVMDNRGSRSVWPEIWNEIQRAISRYGSYYDPEKIPWKQPLTAELVRLVGWQEICLTEAPPTVFEAQCREKWEALTRRQRQEQAWSGLTELESGIPELPE